jgi:ubiquinone/menaquinone biosynthesis C-methylase UbiE
MPEMNALARFFVNTFTGGVNRRRLRWLVANVRLPSNGVFLEVGCGNGDLAARIFDAAGPSRYVATDLDPRQVDVARRHLGVRYPRGIPPNLELREADMLALPFPDSYFDAVFAYTVLHHAGHSRHDFTEVPRALAEIDRVLRPDGKLVCEEFLHKEKIRSWFQERGYALSALGHRWSRDTFALSKPPLTSDSVPSIRS